MKKMMPLGKIILKIHYSNHIILKKIFFANCSELINEDNEYMYLLINNLHDKNDTINNLLFEDIVKSRIYSEVEETLEVESVLATRKRFIHRMDIEIASFFLYDFECAMLIPHDCCPLVYHNKTGEIVRILPKKENVILLTAKASKDWYKDSDYMQDGYPLN